MDNEYNVYEDINTRTGGELYLGIVARSAPEKVHLSKISWN